MNEDVGFCTFLESHLMVSSFPHKVANVTVYISNTINSFPPPELPCSQNAVPGPWPINSCFLFKYINLCVCVLHHVHLFGSPWTTTSQASMSMGFPRQYWSGLPFPPPGYLCDPRVESPFLISPALTSGFIYHWATWEIIKVGSKYYVFIYQAVNLLKSRRKKSKIKKTMQIPINLHPGITVLC